MACALLEEVQVELLDLVAIGTIADMVSLTDENRILVQYGLEMLGHTQRIGLQEMLDMAGIAANEVTEETVGFQIAPRLNALGRLDDPNPAIDLLTGFDDEEAHEIALMIHQKTKSARKSSSLSMKKLRPWWTLRRRFKSWPRKAGTLGF